MKRAFMKLTEAVQQQAKVKMPLSLPEICIGNHRSMAQNHMGLPLGLQRKTCAYLSRKL